MRTNINAFWNFTRIFIILATAYFGYQILRTEKDEFVPGSATVSAFNYKNVNNKYAMNILVNNASPLQVDSIFANPNGSINIIVVDDNRIVRAISTRTGKIVNIRENSISRIMYVKKYDNP